MPMDTRRKNCLWISSTAETTTKSTRSGGRIALGFFLLFSGAELFLFFSFSILLGVNVLMMGVEFGLLCVRSCEALLTRHAEGWYFVSLNVSCRPTIQGVDGISATCRRRTYKFDSYQG